MKRAEDTQGARPVLDFTSALYLGLRHPSRSLRSWTHLTLGAPAALVEPPGAPQVAEALAILQGCARATFAPSTLHIFWDLFGMLSRKNITIYMDAGVYPVARWGVERAAAHGTTLRCFPHQDADALRRQFGRAGRHQSRPVIVTDGFCPGCGTLAPIPAYMDSIQEYDGLLILDDTQALGILGRAPGLNAPYGWGGGGSLRWHEVTNPHVLVISSLAKGFGAPVAAISGSMLLIEQFEERSETRMHSSPPSVAALHAAERALALNQKHGHALRQRLARLVRRFRKQLAGAGFSTVGGLFPVQTLIPIPGLDPKRLYERLLQLGIRTVLRRGHNGSHPSLSFLLTAHHRACEIDRAVDALVCATRKTSTPSKTQEVKNATSI